MWYLAAIAAFAPLVAIVVRCRVDIARMDRRNAEREAEGDAEAAAWLVARGVTP